VPNIQLKAGQFYYKEQLIYMKDTATSRIENSTPDNVRFNPTSSLGIIKYTNS